MEKVVETFNLTKEFEGLIAVDKINLSIDAGEIFGLLGPNGAGKTTLIKMLITLLTPTSGRANVAGFDIVSQANEIRRRIGYVPQDTALDIRLTAYENLRLFADLYSLPRHEIKSRILEVLKLVELDARKKDLVAHFSGGMKRRLEIARGLLPDPKVLFLDEPTAGLDPQTRRVVWDFIHNLQENRNLTIVASTHYLEEAEQEMNRVAIIDFGHIMTMDTPENLKNNFGQDLVEMTLLTGENETQLNEELKSRILTLDLGSNIAFKGDSIRITVASGKHALPSIIHKIESLGLEIDSIGIRSPSLNDVFIKYTGRDIREETERGDYSKDTKKQTAKLIGRMRSRV
ncbi:MAG: ATP-binding cassette domain-containing protein [Promethearchaeota archaeon]